jgi:hypothetical protein
MTRTLPYPVVVRAIGDAGFVAESKGELPEFLKCFALETRRKLNSGADMFFALPNLKAYLILILRIVSGESATAVSDRII